MQGTKTPVDAEESKEKVNLFCNNFVYIKIIHNYLIELFEDEKTNNLLNKIAAGFFQDIWIMNLRSVLLEFAKVTDPAFTRGNENLTVDNLIETIDWPQSVVDELDIVRTELMTFRSFIKDARNKIIAHNDLKAYFKTEVLGAFKEGADRVFVSNLEKFCNITRKASIGEIFGDVSIYHEGGDVTDFKKSIVAALAFEKLMDDAGPEEYQRLMDAEDTFRE
jgi:hypothetical protein